MFDLSSSNLSRYCRDCGTRCEVADMVPPRPIHCWPCRVVWANDHGWPGWELPADGWWQVCERCDQRNFTLTDRPLCPTCVRVPTRWRETLVVCGLCGTLFRRGDRTHRYCCLGTTRRHWMLYARSLGTHTPEEWEARLLEYGNACAYCGTTDEPMTKDHVKPVSKGGPDSIDNIVPACKSCNCSKNDRSLAVWKLKNFQQKLSGADAPPIAVMPSESAISCYSSRTDSLKRTAMP